MTREEYLAKRQAYSDERGPVELWSVIDQCGLYVGVKTLARLLVLAEAVARVHKVPGDLAEFGCWQGATTALFAKMLAIKEPFGNKRVHAFDTFEGFGPALQQEKGLRSDYRGSQETLEAMLTLHGVRERAVLHVGDICKTVTTLDSHLSLALIDCDVYEPCIAAALHVRRLLMPGGLVIFDEWNDDAWPGETRAVRELLAQYGDEFDVEGTNVHQPTLVLRKR